MEPVIGDAIQVNQDSINKWLASNPKPGVPKTFEYNPKQGNLGIGFEVSKAGNSVVKVAGNLDKVNTVLLPDGKGSYLIHTVHPFQGVFYMNWENNLGDLFSATVNQQSLEEAVEMMVSVSEDDLEYHNTCIATLNSAILSCQNGNDETIALIIKVLSS